VRPASRHAKRQVKRPAVALNMLALPALAAFAGLHHPAAAGSAATLTAFTAPAAEACEAWEPVIPGLLYLGTTPVLTLGGVPLIGSGTCLPSGQGYDISVGANLGIPPGDICSDLPLLKISLGVAIGVPAQQGVNPCRVAAAAPPPLPVPAVVPPRPPVVVPPRPPVVVPPRPPVVVPPSAPVLAPPPPSAPALAPPPPPPRHTPPAAPPPPPITPAAVPPPPPPAHSAPPRPPVRPVPAPALAPPPAAAVPAAVRVVKARPHRAHKPAPAAPAPEVQAAPQEPAPTVFKPGQPVMPVGVLVTVVMTPCAATVVARLGKLMAGRG
jgi:hypothetical protein